MALFDFRIAKGFYYVGSGLRIEFAFSFCDIIYALLLLLGNPTDC